MWVKINGLSPNLVCALLLWRSGSGSLMGIFHSFFFFFYRIICPRHIHIFVFSFQDNNLSNGFLMNLIFALILWRPGFGLLVGTFHIFLHLISP